MVMKKAISLIIAIILLAANFAFVSAVEVDGKITPNIEQVYSRLPQIKVYANLSDEYTEKALVGYMDSKELKFNSIKKFDRNEGISFIFMVDCSTSVKAAQMTNIKSILTDFVKNKKNANDRFTIIAFGSKIDILASCSGDEAEVLSAISKLKNNQNATALFDAVNNVKRISDSMDSSLPDKRMCFVFTDAVDYNFGGTTEGELLEAASLTGVPLYTVALNSWDKKSVDTMGQISRKSGGNVLVNSKGDIKAAFNEGIKKIDTIKEISFTSPTNVVTNEVSNMRIFLEGTSTGEKIEKKFANDVWLKDNQRPQIERVELISSKILRVYFTENVVNADNKENYVVKKGVSTYKIASVLYNDSNRSVDIHFEGMIGSGRYSVATANITDNTMEKNQLTDIFSYSITGFGPFMVNIANFFVTYWWAVILLVCLIGAAIMLAVIRNRKGIIMVDSKPTFADSIKYEPIPATPLPTHYLQLIVETADGGTTNLDINISQSVIFGRASSCEVTIDDTNLSRQHFAIEIENGMLFIQNLSQTNGTLLNGIPLQSKRKLSIGDVIGAGQEQFTVSKL